jgi:N-acetylglutamate synthase-like GNAT family acetyltransferase
MHHHRRPRTATAADLKFVDHLQRRYSNQLGHLTTSALAQHLAAGHVTLINERGQEAGYLLARRPTRTPGGIGTIVQTAVLLDARRRSNATALIADLTRTARAAGLDALQATVRTDVQAHDFFRACGFHPVAVRTAPTARSRPAIVYRLALSASPIATAPPRNDGPRLLGPGGRFVARADAANAYRYVMITQAEIDALIAAA